MRILVRVFGPDIGSPYCDYVLLDLDDLRDDLQKKRRLSTPLFDDNKFYGAEWFHYDLQPVNGRDVYDLDWFSGDPGVLVVPEDAEIPVSGFRVDAATVRIKSDGFMWHFYGKHADAGFGTAKIDWSWLDDRKE